jgi:shikimate kinase / 3-dehydroquinate synthase
VAALAPGAQRPSLVFTGFMCSGKSRALRHARAAGLGCADTDELLAAELGSTIAEFFAREGEDEFRRREAELVVRVLAEGHDAIALGGGAILSAAVREALAEHVVIWMRVPGPELWRRAEGSSRPLARDEADFARRLAEREPIYRALADAVMLSADAVPRALPALRAVAAARPACLLWAESASGEYPVWVGDGVLQRAPWPADGRRFRVGDATVANLYGAAVEPVAGSVEVPAGEGAKTLAEAERVLRELARAGMTRADHLVALGGGVVGDLAGFCAATYQRGVAVVQVPTTLLAQVDSAYGGKTGVDLPEAKNYVGAYHLPAGVIADTSTLRTLPAEELAAGFVEVLKTALLAGAEVWERARAVERLDADVLEELIVDCALTKVEVVAADERDSGRREALNLGHTVGHAIEAASGYGRYRHGEAVGLGLLAALRLSGAGGLREQMAAALARHGLPTSLDPAVELDAVGVAVERDKKSTAEGPRFVLLERPGEPIVGARVDPDSLRAAVEELVRAR